MPFLPPNQQRQSTEGTTCLVSQNLVNCCTTVGRSSTDQEQIEVMELEGYSRPTCNKLCVSSCHRCSPQARPSMSFVDNTIDFLSQNFLLSPELGTMFQKEVPLFLALAEFPYNTVWDRSKKAPMPKTSWIRPVVLIQYQLVV